MATQSLSSITGIISGIDYRSLVDQIIAAESIPAVKKRSQETADNAQLTAISTYRGLLTSLQTASTGLRDGSVFDAMSSTTTVMSGTQALLGASVTPAAVSATYQVAVTRLAQAQKVGSIPQVSTSNPLGLAGEFTVNGQKITVVAGDTLTGIRDKINLLNQGAGATKVSATILTVGPNASKLVLSSQVTGAAGIGLADTTGSVLQGLGILSNPTTINAASVMQTGEDADFTIDNIPFKRTTNVISDAIDGVTLTLTAAETGAVTQLAVDRFADSAKASVQAYVDAYNKVVDFLKAQGTADPTGATAAPALYGNNMIRTMRARLPEAMLSSIAGTARDMDTAGRAGVALDKTGHLTLDATKFVDAFTNRLSDVRQLFQQAGVATGAGLSFTASTVDTTAGTYAVNVTQLATQASVTGAGLSGGIFTDDATPDTMTVTDTRLGKSANISLANGMTSAQIATALTTAFQAAGLGLTAVDNAGQVQISQGGYGSSPAITVAYTAGGAAGSAPIAAGTYSNGLDIAGTLGGFAATGSGQTLLGSTGTAVMGLSVSYSGIALGAAGSLDVTLGTGALMERLMRESTLSGSGTLDGRVASLNTQIAQLEDQATQIDGREAIRRDSLLKQFAAMESALAAFRNQSASVTALLNSSTSNTNGN
ncbi:MAG: flagellar filament capping protein FliD [Gemmatimonadota bacterium]